MLIEIISLCRLLASKRLVDGKVHESVFCCTVFSGAAEIFFSHSEASFGQFDPKHYIAYSCQLKSEPPSKSGSWICGLFMCEIFWREYL